MTQRYTKIGRAGFEKFRINFKKKKKKHILDFSRLVVAKFALRTTEKIVIQRRARPLFVYR